MVKRKRLLITGIPGAGKTCIGKQFEKKGFKHIDVETEQIKMNRLQNTKDFHELIDGLLSGDTDVVVTYGFRPYQDQEKIDLFKQNGFQIIWFDGNRPAAFREFIKRELKRYEDGKINGDNFFKKGLEFFIQIQNIESSDIIGKIKPIIINSFDSNEKFKSSDEIIKEIDQKLV